MPVFISYSHDDAQFVDSLAAQLVRNRVQVWVDRWELQVGDSLVHRVEEAITGASALIVVLSRSSVESEWCRKELTAGLVRELEEKRVVVLPVIVNDCDIPLFLRDKKYADFRRDHDAALREVLESIAHLTNAWMARTDSPDWHTDWSIDWDNRSGKLWVRVTFVEHAVDQPYSVISEVAVTTDERMSAFYNRLARDGVEDDAVDHVIGAVAAAVDDGLDLTMLLTDQRPQTREVALEISNLATVWNIRLEARRLGDDTGRDVVLHLGNQVLGVHSHVRNARGDRTGWSEQA